MNFADLVRSVSGIQPGAQANLPVMPNNGNPMGASNTPMNAPAMPQPINPMLQHYPWMAPSPAMDHIQQMLASPLLGGFANSIHPIQAGGPVVAPGTGHAIPMPTVPGTSLPALPVGGISYGGPLGRGPTVPQSLGISGANIGQLQTMPVMPVTTYDQDMYGAGKVF